MRKAKILIVLLLSCFFITITTIPAGVVMADAPIDQPAPNKDKENSEKVPNRVEPTDDSGEIYKRYKDNTFTLMTKEYESFTGFKAMFVNITGIFKNMAWAIVQLTGNFNTILVKFLFSLDIVSPIKEPIKQMTATIAGSMLTIAGSIGIVAVSLIMTFKYAKEQKFKQVFKIFCMTIAIFTTLVMLKDTSVNSSLIDKALQLDSAIEGEFVKVNPVLNSNDDIGKELSKNATPDQKMSSVGENIASKVFRSNVYDPYLLMQYGTSKTDKIREKEVEYKGETYDRIGILLDNDIDGDIGTDFFEQITKYESETLNNKDIMFVKNIVNALLCVFYFILNIIQTFVYFILAVLRLMIQFLQIILFPVGAILLLVGLFNFGTNVFVNYFKAFMITIMAKSMCSFATIFFATYISLGYASGAELENPFQQILMIVIYLILPFSIYFFRYFLGALFTGKLSINDAVGFMTSPRRMNRMYKQEQARQKEARRDRREQERDRKKKEFEERRKKGENPNPLNEKNSGNSNNDPSKSRSKNPESENNPDGSDSENPNGDTKNSADSNQKQSNKRSPLEDSNAKNIGRELKENTDDDNSTEGIKRSSKRSTVVSDKRENPSSSPKNSDSKDQTNNQLKQRKPSEQGQSNTGEKQTGTNSKQIKHGSSSISRSVSDNNLSSLEQSDPERSNGVSNVNSSKSNSNGKGNMNRQPLKTVAPINKKQEKSSRNRNNQDQNKDSEVKEKGTNKTKRVAEPIKEVNKKNKGD